MEISEHSFQSMLRSRYYSTSKYIIENLYFFSNDWESDMFIVKNNGYTYEIEIKISVADFNADFKKTKKHDTLKSGKFRPNKFFYCIPEAIATKIQVPEYAGLIIISPTKGCCVSKEAPFLHKEKLEVEKNIALKLYSRWRNQVVENKRLNRDMKYLRENINKPNLFN